MKTPAEFEAEYINDMLCALANIPKPILEEKWEELQTIERIIRHHATLLEFKIPQEVEREPKKD